ncbi:MAG: acetylornithine/succinylornithine family transaminase [Ignavibacteriaceae bacterium]|nr:acetylornithine/succinylornithine family transaminase [Ignavibacteriaceae bacterium]
MKNKLHLLEKEKKYFLNTYSRIPLEVTHGEGVYLFTSDGKKYLDFFSGLGVNALGHSHPKISKAVKEQIEKFSHLSNYYITDIQIEFAELLLEHSRMENIFLTNSGTEAVEATLKLLRKKYGPRNNIFSLTNSFHGRTYGALSLTAQEKYTESFKPLLPKINQLKFNNLDYLREHVNENTAAIFLEFVQGEGGINFISQEYITLLKELKDKYDFAVVADEIQSGIGRTGKGFSFEHFNIIPDIIICAKAIGGGLPLGALLTSSNYADVFAPGDHGTTFGGNPIACAAGKVVLNEVFENGLVYSVAKLGEYFIKELNKFKHLNPDKIKEVRGKGFMIGVEIPVSGDEIIKQMREKNILINSTNNNTLRILPPLISTKTEINIFLESFCKVL